MINPSANGWIDIGALLIGKSGVNALADDFRRDRDDVDRGLRNRGDDAAGKERGDEQDWQICAHFSVMPAWGAQVDRRSVHPHRFGGECLGFDQQAVVGGRSCGERFAADDDHQRDRQRGDAGGADVDHLVGSALDEPGKAAKFRHPRAGVVPSGGEEEVAGVIFAQDVVDEVGREADLAPGLALAGMLALDEPADDRDFAKGAFEQVGLFDPFDEFMFEDVGREQGRGVDDFLEAVAGQRIVVGDEAERFEPG